jgi:glutamyl-tRNA synthetase
LALDDKAAGLLNADARALIGDLMPDLAAIEDWSAQATEEAVRAFSEKRGVKLGAVAQPLRAALTGRTTSPGIFDVLSVLGKPESLARLSDQAQRPAV